MVNVSSRTSNRIELRVIHATATSFDALMTVGTEGQAISFPVHTQLGMPLSVSVGGDVASLRHGNLFIYESGHVSKSSKSPKSTKKPTYGLIHYLSGEVVEVGKNVKGFKPGDRLIRCTGQPNPGREFINVPPRFSAKVRGFSPQKPGAYAQYVAFNVNNAMRIPEGVNALDASLVEPLTVAVHAVRQSQMRLGDKVMVLGGGPIGLFTQQCADLSGAAEVYVSEVNAARLKAASRLGAARTFNALRENVVKEVEKITGIGADVAFECAGAKPTLQQALELVRMGGRVMLIALAWENVECLPVDWVGRHDAGDDRGGLRPGGLHRRPAGPGDEGGPPAAALAGHHRRRGVPHDLLAHARA